MSTLDALLAAIVADPCEETRWLVLADWLQENDQPDRAELLGLHRKMIATCLEPDAHPERAGWQARMVELLVAGVRPCVPQETLTLPGGVSMTFSFIPPGSFLMGSENGNSDERPVRLVAVDRALFLGTASVTQAQWAAVMGTDPSHFKGAKRPVEQVSSDDAREFCARLSARLIRRVELPTEMEWEFACRAGTTTEYYFGDAIRADLVNYDAAYTWNGSPKGRPRGRTTTADLFPVNPWGLSDMHGNVWDWCADRFGESDESLETQCVARGGCWDAIPSYCRSAIRCVLAHDHRNYRHGFRASLYIE